MPIQASSELSEVARGLLEAWRDGNAEHVEALLSNDACVIIGSPGPTPAAIGQHAVRTLIQQRVPMGKAADGPKADFTTLMAHADGGIGWVYGEGALRIPDRGAHAMRVVLVLRSESGHWRWLQWFGFMPVPMQLMGTATLGFI